MKKSDSASTNSPALTRLLKDVGAEGVIKLPLVKEVPGTFENLRRLERLGLLTEEVLLALLALAPIDPHGLLRALQTYIPHWTFQPLNCTVITILAKVKDKPVALMQIDLMSSDILFIARQKEQLVAVATLAAEEVVSVLQKPGITPEQAWAWFQEHIAQTIRTGQAG